MAPEVIRELVEVSARPVVVRLDHLEDQDPTWISARYHLTQEVVGHLDIIGRLLAGEHGCGVFLVGQYGCGKSHFLAFLTQRIRAGALPADAPAPQVVPVSLINYRAEVGLEDIVAGAVGLESGAGDRRVEWEKVARRFPSGLCLAVDELSEFLRSKPTREGFNEDVRFLQYMGEWAQSHRFWVVAAMQEQIEHTGALESSLYRKIKDRFPVRLLLTPGHVRDLLRDSLLEKKDGYSEAVEALVAEVRHALPDVQFVDEDLRELYPIHPVTLELLEEVRDLFSQTRGVVDFVITSLCGNPDRNVAPFLDRPWGELLTPEHIVDHFADLFELQPEFQPLAQKLLPHYRRHLDSLFATQKQRDLAWRILKLLILAHISPRRSGVKVQEASEWLLFRATSIDPDRNLQIVERVLRQLTADGRYVKEQGGRFALDLRDDSGERLERALRREVADLQSATADAVWEMMLPLLGDLPFNPFTLARDRWQSRTVRWHFHERPYAVYFGSGEPGRVEVEAALCIRLPWGEPAPAAGCATVVPARLELTPQLYELAALVRLAERPGDDRLRQLIERRIRDRKGLLVTQVQNAFLESRLFAPDGRAHPPVPLDTSVPLKKWLDSCAVWLMRRVFPSFERFAPTHGPLPKEAYRRFMRVAAEHDIGDFEGDEYVKLIREAYLVPMGLMNREGWYYTVVPRLERNELVQLVMPLAHNQVAPKVVYEHLAQPVYGLVPDQVHLLLLFLHLHGEIDIVKEKRSYRDLYETLPTPLQYDRIVPGRALSVDLLKALEELCDGFKIRLPKQWTVAAQRHAIGRLRQVGARQRGRLQPLVLRIRELGEGSELVERLERVARRWSALDKGDNEIQGLEHFIHEIGSARAFLNEQKEIADLPERLDTLLGNLRRLNHLLAHPAVQAWKEPAHQLRLESIGESPGLGDLHALESWLTEARATYDAYTVDYRSRHEEWWQEFDKQGAQAWAPPALARSRHLGGSGEVDEYIRSQSKLRAMRCPGVSDLAFQPSCTCGFDGSTAPVQELAERCRNLRKAIESRMRLFFQQQEVRERMQGWPKQGGELTQATLRYLDGSVQVPEIADVDLFDRYLAGVELVQEVAADELLLLLEGRVWAPAELLKALEQGLRRYRGKRLRIVGTPGHLTVQDEVVTWCVEQALRRGIPLPPAMAGCETESLQPDWVSVASLGQLESLGLGRRAVGRVVGWIVAGDVDAERVEMPSPVVAAALEVAAPVQPSSPADLARLAEVLYAHHPQLGQVLGDRWLDRLHTLAEAEIEGVPDLVDVLRGHLDWQWLMVDCLGLSLLDTASAVLEAREGWRHEKTLFGRVSATTTTDACFRQLAEAGIEHPIEKVNGIDRLLHERQADHGDFRRLAAAELEVALGQVGARLEPGRPVLVFADHGFRLARDGSGWVHGGASTLERVVPVFEVTLE